MKQLRVSILLASDGTRTVAEAHLAQVLWKEALVEPAMGRGSSGREPGDKSAQSVGEDLATARALRSLAARLERRANGAVKHAEDIKAHRAEIAERKAAEHVDVRLKHADFEGYFAEIHVAPPTTDVNSF